MNFLGHLYFSQNDLDLMYSNLYGDFVKGNKLNNFSELTQKGIRLHREIDHFIDTHPIVSELRREISSDLPKVGGIAIDLYFDHVLAKSWDDYHSTKLNQFITDFHRHSFNKKELSNVEFLFLIQKMEEGNWIYNYQFTHGLTFACVGLSRRISFDNVLWKAPDVYLNHEKLINHSFHAFMNDAIPHFKSFKTT